MRPILSDIMALAQHLILIDTTPQAYKPDRCPYCGFNTLWCHGPYPRKSDRESPPSETLNPILIPRFYCISCKRTCSVLPECIPPRRWYLWKIQQATLLAILTGASITSVAKHALPSRQTISRWMKALQDNFEQHAACLRARFAWLGYATNLAAFWQAWLDKFALSKAFYNLNIDGCAVP